MIRQALANSPGVLAKLASSFFVRFQTWTVNPFFRRFSATRDPIMPSPMTPTFLSVLIRTGSPVSWDPQINFLIWYNKGCGFRIRTSGVYDVGVSPDL